MMAESMECVDISGQAEADHEENDKPADEDGKGERMHTLDKAMSMTLKKVVSAMKLSVFRKVYRPLYEKNPEIVKKLNKQMKGQLECNMKEEITLMYQEEQIHKLMNGLEDIVDSQKANAGNSAWRPTGNIEMDSFAVRMDAKKKQKSYMEHIVTQLESQNSLFKKHVYAGRKRIHNQKQKIKKECEDHKQISTEVPDQLQQCLQKFSGKGVINHGV